MSSSDLESCVWESETTQSNRMVGDLQEQVVCFSEFNRIYRTNFPNVSIPKVHITYYNIFSCYYCKINTHMVTMQKYTTVFSPHLQFLRQTS